jgi:hypothetical protein
MLILLLSCVGYCFSPSKDSVEKAKSDKTFTSLKKSLLFPGWGQFAEKRYVEGVLFFAAEAFCLYNIFSYNHKGNKNYALYKDATNVDDAVKFRELTEKFDTKRNISILAAAGIWMINLIDIYLIVKSKEKKQLKMKIESGKNKILAFSVSYSF